MANLNLPGGRVVPVTDGMIIGRVASCDVVIDDDKVSRKHARIVVQSGVAEIEDLGSRNGVFLNGHRVLRRVLRDGDSLRVGKTDLVFLEPASAAPAAAGENLLGGADLLADEPAAEPEPPSPSRPVEDRPSSAPEDVEVIEFVDEVVEVRRRAVPDSPRASSAPAARPQRGGVLQFSKQSRAGALDEDVGQLGGLPRLLVALAAVAVAVGAGWAAMTLLS